MSNVMVPIESPWVVSYLTSFESNVVSLAIFEIFDIKDISIGAMVSINSTSGLADRNISDFHQKRWVTTSHGKFGGKFGEDLWKIAICRAFNSFCVTD